MNINAEAHFTNLPQLAKNVQRTIFNQSYTHLTTFNAGKLIPIYCQKYMPGDTFNIRTKLLVRMSTPIHPVMDNCYLDIHFFSVPKRLVWDHTREFYGENTTSEWEQEVEYEIPQIKAPTGGWRSKSIADYLGVRPGIDNLEVDALKFRAVAMIWNEWYRDENLQKPIIIDKGDSTVIGSNDTDFMISAILGGELLPVNKFHDRFTSCLPEPQKGPEVTLPLGLTAPVLTNGDAPTTINISADQYNSYTYDTPIYRNNNDGSLNAQNTTQNAGTNVNTNLMTDLSNATAATINDLYQAMAIQALYVIAGRSGTRYREIIKGNFGITTSDATIQIPEFLYGRRIPINMNQVVQTSSTDENSPQGNTAAFSLTIDMDSEFTKSFEEWGYLFGFACVRHTNTYQQGIDAEWFEKRRFDEYWPALANLGEQPVYNRELYATGTDADSEVFGYQEAWSNYRYKTNRVSGEFRSGVENTLDAWHYADNYDSQPILGPEWIKADASAIDRTLAVTSEVSDQFHADFHFEQKVVRPLPQYSIPGIPRTL